MFSRKIIYSVLIVISVFFYILFVDKLSFYIMVFVFSLPVAFLIVLLSAKIGVKCKLTAVSKTAMKKSGCDFNLKIVNKTFFPYPSSVVKIYYRNDLSENEEIMKISFPVHPRTSQTLTFRLSSEYCGVLNVKIHHIRIYDYIKLFSCRVKTETNAHVYITPDPVIQSVPDAFRTIVTDESNEFSKYKSGDDPSEIFELKEFVQGDKINRIHWNLSSKQNQLITKHYSLAVNTSVAIIVDIDFNSTLQKIDTALEFFYTLSYSLTEHHINHVLYVKGLDKLYEISDYEHLEEVYINILKYKSCSENDSEIISKLTAEKSDFFLVTNRPFKNYDIPDISDFSRLKCFFIDLDTSEIRTLGNNVTISLIRADNFESVPDDLFL